MQKLILTALVPTGFEPCEEKVITVETVAGMFRMMEEYYMANPNAVMVSARGYQGSDEWNSNCNTIGVTWHPNEEQKKTHPITEAAWDAELREKYAK